MLIYAFIGFVIATLLAAFGLRRDHSGDRTDQVLVVFLSTVVGAAWFVTVPLGLAFGAVWFAARYVNGRLERHS